MEHAIHFPCGVASLRTRWYKPSEMDHLVDRVITGDLIEMGRGIYSHWAVYAGTRMYGSDEVPCVFHCGSDPRLTCGKVVFGCVMFRKRAHGMGDVVLEPLKDVCGRSHARLNNRLDSKRTPFDPEAIIQRAELQNVDPQEYSVFLNNCEHFAKWCRYGVKECEQLKSKCVEMVRYAGTYVPTVAFLNIAFQQLSGPPSDCGQGKLLEESIEMG